VFDVDKAMADDAPQLYESVLLGDEELPIRQNVACRRQVNVGDVSVGFAEADLIVERRYHTGRVYHAQMEPKAAGVGRCPTADRAVGDAAVHSQHPPAPGRIFGIR